MSHQQHRQQAPGSIRCAVITVSDTRTPENDTSGQYMQQALTQAGHTISAYSIVKDEPEDIRRLLTHFIQAEDTEAILLSGGTGLSPRDGTYEVVQRTFSLSELCRNWCSGDDEPGHGWRGAWHGDYLDARFECGSAAGSGEAHPA